MRITLKGRYALRAMLVLAKTGKDGGMVSISSLSEAEDISAIFLEQIFFRLKKAELVKSIRGPGGGFMLNRPLDAITVKEVLDAAGEELTMKLCNKEDEQCDHISDCISHKVFASVTEKINSYLGSLTLKKIIESKEFKPD